MQRRGWLGNSLLCADALAHFQTRTHHCIVLLLWQRQVASYLSAARMAPRPTPMATHFPGPLGRCEWRRRDRRHHVFTLNASRNRHSMAPLAENGPCWALPPKNVTDKALGASRDIWAASGIPPGVPTVRPSRRGQWSDVILAHTHQYSTCTGPASASHSFSTKLQLGKKEKRWRLTFAECLQAENPTSRLQP